MKFANCLRFISYPKKKGQAITRYTEICIPIARGLSISYSPWTMNNREWINYPPTYCSDSENKTSRSNNTKLTHTSKMTIFQEISQWKQSKMKFSSAALFHPKCCPHWVIISEGICIPAALKNMYGHNVNLFSFEN